VVTADGFNITRQEVLRYKKLIEQKFSFYSDDRTAHIEAAIKTWVFAQEAMQLGYDQKFIESGRSLSDDEVVRRIQLFLIYQRKFLQDYELEDRVVLSYFRSNTALQEPLDANMRDQIHDEVVGASTKKIIKEESLVLKAKYNVEIVNFNLNESN
jgi:hypothetical protein